MALAQIKLIVDVAVLSGRSTALLKFAAGPDEQPGWFIPNTQLVEQADPYDAAREIVKAQLGIELPGVTLVDLESFTGRDGSWHLALHFKGTVPQDTALIPGAGVASARWFPLDDLPDRSAVAHHGWYLHVIARAAEKV